LNSEFLKVPSSHCYQCTISNSNFHWPLITGAYLQNGKSGKISDQT